MTFYELLVIFHVIGTVLGVGAATFAEIHYTRFNSDDILDEGERKTLGLTYTVMRTGLFLLVLSGFAFLLHYRLTENVAALTSPPFLAKMTIIGILLGNALLLQARYMPIAVGAAVSLTSWYAALVLGVIGRTTLGYFEILAYYAAAVLVMGLLLRMVRSYVHMPQKTL